MWQLTASMSTEDGTQAEATALFLRNCGFDVQVVNTRFAAMDLSLYFYLSWERKVLEAVQSAGLVTLDDVTKLSFEEFWRLSKPWGTDVRSDIMYLMGQNSARFTDVDPGKFVKDFDSVELGDRAYKCLMEDDLYSLVMLIHLPASVLRDIPNFGKRCLADVRAMLRTHGMTLKGE